MLGEIAGLPNAPVHFSRNWSTEVWSETSEVTQPPRVHGEISSSGTRKPRPTGAGAVRPYPVKSVPLTNSSASPGAGTGGGTWSKPPSFSSKLMMTSVELKTSGSALSACSTWCT